jgi:hypothetical protein
VRKGSRGKGSLAVARSLFEGAGGRSAGGTAASSRSPGGEGQGETSPVSLARAKVRVRVRVRAWVKV